LIASVSRADLLCPDDESVQSRKIARLVKYLRGSDLLASRLARFPTQDTLDEAHDLIIVIADNPWQLHALERVRGWREHPARRVCYLAELWPPALKSWRLMREPFALYDHLFIGTTSPVIPLQQLTGVPCSFLPVGVDTDVFTPHPYSPRRCIDVNYIGRREPGIHSSLLRGAAQDDYFYFFDTIRVQDIYVDDYKQHRTMYSNVLKRSATAIAVPAKSTNPGETGGSSEISGRLFEFSAAGAAILGRRPRTEAFDRLFGWEDAVIDLPDDATRTARRVNELLHEESALFAVQQRNIVNALRKHDWVYRWQQILAAVELAPEDRARQRVAALARRADDYERLTLAARPGR